jgi:hypothetical protein
MEFAISVRDKAFMGKPWVVAKPVAAKAFVALWLMSKGPVAHSL